MEERGSWVEESKEKMDGGMKMWFIDKERD